ncbi:MAG: universal stress protein UspA [Gammaproteobacteria bacterium]|nr:universal stress protein UspA [Gammaproteobacteria bacterium]
MSAILGSDQSTVPELQQYRSILVGVDASDYSNRGVKEALDLAEIWQSKVSGAHVYAAQMHDQRFKQMEGGLPEKYQEEQELEKQRDIHDDLITKGLSVITDSYLDQVEIDCRERSISYQARSLEGKNYQQLAREANSGSYDLLVMGSLGLGAVQSSRVGTVCERVVRRSDIDTLVIKNPEKPIKNSPIVVAIDGSALSNGGLLTGFTLAQEWQVPLHVISAYDPYYHYVAFNRIAGVLSDEAGKVFRFKEQEQLHEDIIDAGLARIYQGHLEVAESLADQLGINITTKLLDGKPYEVIQQYVDEVDAGLLILGKTGIHADEDLDIGGQAENLFRNVGCAVLLSHRGFTPDTELIAESTTSWTHQAEERMNAIPEFVRSMARLGILRFAQEKGHTVITESIVEAATTDLCPVNLGGSGAKAVPDQQMAWNEAASSLLNAIASLGQKQAIRMKAEKKARQSGSTLVEENHIQGFLGADSKTAESKCPFNGSADKAGTGDAAEPKAEAPHWTSEALERLEKVPEGFMRKMTSNQVETFALSQNYDTITPAVIDEKYGQWGEGSESQEQKLKWELEAIERLERIPAFVRGMVMKEVENHAESLGVEQVTVEIMQEASGSWQDSMKFHSKPGQPS